MDFFDIIKEGTGEGFADSLFKVQDSDGKLLILRGEVTTQIARMLASKARDETRLFYITNCVKYIDTDAIGQREFWQAGAELIGGDPASSDAEVIALALSILDSIGLKGAQIDVGSVGLFRYMLDYFDIANYDGVIRAVKRKSVDDLKGINMDPRALEMFTYMISRRGGIEVIEKLSEMADGDLGGQKAYFRKLFRLLDAFGCAGRVKIDLGTLREMKYYNGIIFEVFLGGIGTPLGGGGRYDAMMKEFGLEESRATGFAISVDTCIRALESCNFGFNSKERPLGVFFLEGYEEAAIALARKLRASGKGCYVSAYNGEREGILVSKGVLDLSTGKELQSEGMGRQ